MMDTSGAILAVGMLVTGTMNTIFTTWQDKTSAVGSDGTLHKFSHPGFQTLTMFIGESLCLVVFLAVAKKAERKKSNKSQSGNYSSVPVSSRTSSTPQLPKVPLWAFALPTCCDLTATTIMNVGLIFTTASVYQMIRGAMVLFTAVFSVVFLKRKLFANHYLGLTLVIIGIFTVGLASVLYSPASGAINPALGNTLVFFAQIIVATQFVLEEKFLGQYHAPALQAVGLEGAWGVGILCIILPILQFVCRSDGTPLENTQDAWVQVMGSWQLMVGNLGSIFSIAFFNFFGISVTKQLSATHRTTIDSCRTILIWIVSLMLGWESFIPLQLLGFFFLVVGTFIYNEVILLPGFLSSEKDIIDIIERERQPLLDSPFSEDALEETGPPPSPRSPMDLRLSFYTRLQIPAARNELPAFVTEALGEYRKGVMMPR
eukprot:CFRG1292T1